MELMELAKKSRTYRRFYEDQKVDTSLLEGLIGLVRYCPSAGNNQPLKFILSCDPAKNGLIYPNLAWAAYLKDWDGPDAGERPTAYIVMLADTEISKSVVWDHGIVAQTLMLGAVEKGLGGCIIASVKKEGLRAALNIPERYEILMVLALGKPKEKVVVDDIGADGSVKYWRDADRTHHVPKRRVEDFILKL